MWQCVLKHVSRRSIRQLLIAFQLIGTWSIRGLFFSFIAFFSYDIYGLHLATLREIMVLRWVLDVFVRQLYYHQILFKWFDFTLVSELVWSLAHLLWDSWPIDLLFSWYYQSLGNSGHIGHGFSLSYALFLTRNFQGLNVCGLALVLEAKLALALFHFFYRRGRFLIGTLIHLRFGSFLGLDDFSISLISFLPLVFDYYLVRLLFRFTSDRVVSNYFSLLRPDQLQTQIAAIFSFLKWTLSRISW